MDDEPSGGRDVPITDIPYERGWHRLGRHTFAWLEPDGRWGLTNTGLVRDDGGEALLVDTLFDLPHTAAMLGALTGAAPGTRIGTVVNTHANGDHYWGNQLVTGADIVVSAATAREMEHAPTPGLLQELTDRGDNRDAFSAYLKDINRDFDFRGIEPPPPTREFTGRLDIRVGHLTATAIDMGAQHTEGDTVVWVPEDRVLFAGDLLFVGVHPTMWAGPIGNWIAACAAIEDLRPRVIVPGHGPVTDLDGVRDFRDYLEHVQRESAARYESGMPWQEAAVDLSLGRWSHWADPERLAVTVAAVYRDLAGQAAGGTTAEDMIRVMTIEAEIALGIRRKPRLGPLQPAERDIAITAMLTPELPDMPIARHLSAHPPLNVFTTLVRNPDLFRAWAPLAEHLNNGTLPARDRELAILRTAVRCASAYEWAQHTAVAAEAGLTAEEIARCARVSDAAGWSACDKALLDAADELHSLSTLSQPTWDTLAAHYTDAQLIELVVLIGHYHQVAFGLNAFRTPTDSWVTAPPFPAVPAG
jgi:glyoxylase-like metal-dependent hydrolase (beta-lactamase superfamily II)/alkylhydroperoxidase family enzyme